MKRSFAILISIVVLAAGMQVSIDRHYCGGSLAAVKISVTGKLATCGMKQAESTGFGNVSIDKKCCEDQLSVYSLGSNYYPEYFKLTHPGTERSLPPISSWCFISGNTFNSDLTNRALPPGPDIQKCLSRPQICIFQV
jgi:hypothetical protein